MPRNGSGTYTLPEPSFVPGTTISSTAMNSDLSDIALALTGSMAADGQTPFTGNFLISDGSETSPSYTFTAAQGTGIYRDSNGVNFSIDGTFAFGIRSTGIVGPGGLAFSTPVGIMSDYAGATAPTGWLLCDGSAIDRTTYASLFTAIGTLWGSGNGSSTFNVPDMRGRIGVGKDNMGGVAADRITVTYSGMDGTILANTGGAQGVQLSTSQIPSHNHTGTTGGQSQDHTHTYNEASSPQAKPASAGTAPPVVIGSSNTGGSSQDHTHSFTSNDTGGDDFHNNVQPTAIVNKIIYAGV